VREGAPVVDFHDERDATYTELTVCAIDDPQPGLLARIAGVLYAADLNVHGAQVVTRVTDRDRIALDTLWVDFRGRHLAPGKQREVSANLTSVLTGAKTVREVLLTRRAPAVRRSSGESVRLVSVRDDLSPTLTVIEVASQDVSGEFFRVCEALSRLGWDIHSARASTWRDEVRASFYVEGARGQGEEAIRHKLLAALGLESAAGINAGNIRT
jgi:[protein-PII] uridylyltransferase